jgi:hypothetical protein
MTRQLQAGFVDILLLLAISCTKENNSPLSGQSSQSSQELKASTSPSADESVANGILPSVLGPGYFIIVGGVPALIAQRL